MYDACVMCMPNVHVYDVQCDMCMQVVGEYHLGDMVNRFQHGSLVMQLPDSETARIPTLLFGTILGIIGVIASIPREQYQFLEKLQVATHSAHARPWSWWKCYVNCSCLKSCYACFGVVGCMAT